MPPGVSCDRRRNSPRVFPDLDGFEVLRRLRLDGSKVPVLFLTARDTAEELVAQVHAMLRRSGGAASAAKLSLADLDHVWQYDFGGNATVVETYISYLRKKIDAVGQPLIQTVRGVGYTLRLD